MVPRKKINTQEKSKFLGHNWIEIFKPLQLTLERDFYADCTLSFEQNDSKQVHLVIHLTCHFSLTESLFHLNNGNWGNFQSTLAGDIKTSPFQTALVALENEYQIAFEISELSIHLRDTSIIIGRLPNIQIQNNLEHILDSVSANFVHFTQGLSRMPYEIFVPIYEETPQDFAPSEHRLQKYSSYFEYWGLYFENEPDGLVYDVKNKVIIEESDFFLLNQWG